MRWWRVQATWSVDGDERSYAPLFTRTRSAADRAQRELEDAHRDLPGLAVTIRPASAGELPPIHLVLGDDGATTACGLAVESVEVRAWPVLFGAAAEERRCPACVGRAAG